MTWAVILALVGVVLVVAIRVLRAPRAGWEALLAALFLGLAGYALQGRPDLPAAPHAADANPTDDGVMLVEDRRLFEGPALGAPLLIVADAFVRHGDYAAAVDLLQGLVAREPGNGQAWLALGNALVAHAGGTLSPAALFAFRNAATVAPGDGAVPYFLGLAMAGNGRFSEARDLWASALAKAPVDATWRPMVVRRLARLDQLIRMTGGAAR